MSTEHDENFPVASRLCPPAMRPAVLAIYRFARAADDVADEGEAQPQARREELARHAQALEAAGRGQAPDWRPEIYAPLTAAIARHQLPLQPLRDLLSAFEQDTHGRGHADRAALLDYCRRSANPVGRLMLHLAGVNTPQALAQSDAICTALQLINFWQDPSVDLPRGRCLFPRSDLRRHGLDAVDWAQPPRDTAATQAMLAELGAWAAALMHQGAPLALAVPGRLGWELRGVVQGGWRVLEKIALGGWRTLQHRPVLGRADLALVAWRALRMRPGRPMPVPPLPLPPNLRPAPADARLPGWGLRP